MTVEKSRLFILNLYFVFLGMVVAWLLYRVAREHSDRPAFCAFFVLFALYGTFLWNYQRGQTYELFQVLFFIAFLFYYQRFLGRTRTPELLFATLCVGVLVHVKSIYVFILPFVGVGALIALARNRPSGEAMGKWWVDSTSLRMLALGFLMPAVAAVILLLLANDHKFGSALNTGYGQWYRYEGVDLFAGDAGEAIRGFLVDPQRSVFLHFPLLIFAVWGVRQFWRRRPHEAVLICAIFLGYFLLYAKFIDWKGEWSYGPRYLLFVLPVLSLPFLVVLDAVHREGGRWHSLLLWALLVPVVAAGVASQVLVNSLDFFAYYQFKNAASGLGLLDNPMAAAYFRDTHFALVHLDLINYLKNGTAPPFVENGSFADVQLRLWLSENITGNYFWWDLFETR
ncbi:MAG: hypothetical protein R3298_01920 [Gammaproteobacteria bacterium]|nr:hypothetical protein [Gammaproteobacteria bacterium]